MSLSLTRVAVGFGAIGGVSGLGYLSFRNFSPDKDKRSTVSKLFKDQGRTLLTKGSDEDQWKSRWSEYVKEGKNIWNLGDYESQKADTNRVPDSFQEKCLVNSETNVSGIEDPLYSEVIKHCSKEFTVSHFVSKRSGITSLNTASDQDNDGWNAAWKKYLDDNGSNNPWDVSGWVSSSQPTTAPEDFRTKCNSKKDEKILWDKDDRFSKFVSWCTKDTQ
ncbi:hypothetical protein MHC_04710 [Mycoplasma haemocanis str. Illinois]|uniref:Uncharacterized protein n=1 Tax=Mycoplasma haemocanis (strain Illinois) TaxID=1111676 RepID=H6N826_MYCHN|nr:hypothetical protein [Mycoplasma haemocanis]AEW45798.1 hypothetical protein MHC_04710 [Mycoplasma haemocanis str. Illinois]